MSDQTILRLTSPTGDVLYAGVFTNPDTGETVPIAEITKNSVGMWLAVQDGVAVIFETDDEQIVLAPFDWIEKTFTADATDGLPHLRKVLQEEGMLP